MFPQPPTPGIMADGRSGFIYGMDLAGPERTWEELTTTFWTKAVQQAGARPEFIRVCRAEWMAPLHPLAETLEARLLLEDRLPAITEARAAVERFPR